MRGRPWMELLMVGVVALLLLVPLTGLTRAGRGVGVEVPVEAGGETEGATEGVPAWLDVRVSHVPEGLTVFHGEAAVLAVGGEMRGDADVMLVPEGGLIRMRVAGRLPDGVEAAYVELNLEPEGGRPLRGGVWTRGEFSHILEFRWPEE